MKNSKFNPFNGLSILMIFFVLLFFLGLFLSAEVSADVIISQNTTISAENTAYDNQSLIIDGCTVTVDGSHTFQALTLRSNAVLTHSGATTTTTSKLDLNIATTLTIDSTSKIDVSGRGYLGGWQGGNNNDTGRTLGNTTTGGSGYMTGGSYGGLGGVGSTVILPMQCMGILQIRTS